LVVRNATQCISTFSFLEIVILSEVSPRSHQT
jgi:hypothetical protein